ncbi:TPA: ATP-binding protein [Salmonella enterica subsp. diarizonae serovar 61:l,v:z35]
MLTSWLDHLKQLQTTQVLIVDDLGLEPLINVQCHDLLEIIEDRYGQSSTIVVSQFPVGKARSDGEPDKLSSRMIE